MEKRTYLFSLDVVTATSAGEAPTVPGAGGEEIPLGRKSLPS